MARIGGPNGGRAMLVACGDDGRLVQMVAGDRNGEETMLMEVGELSASCFSVFFPTILSFIEILTLNRIFLFSFCRLEALM
jgi:hypothetical protein